MFVYDNETAVKLPTTLQDRLKVLSDMTRDAGLSKTAKISAARERVAKKKAGPFGTAYKIPRNPKVPLSPPKGATALAPRPIQKNGAKDRQVISAETHSDTHSEVRDDSGVSRDEVRSRVKRRRKKTIAE